MTSFAAFQIELQSHPHNHPVASAVGSIIKLLNINSLDLDSKPFYGIDLK